MTTESKHKVRKDGIVEVPMGDYLLLTRVLRERIEAMERERQRMMPQLQELVEFGDVIQRMKSKSGASGDG